MELNDWSGQIVGAAMRVHSMLGPGLLEGAYEVCLAHELRTRGLRVATQVSLPIIYHGVRLDAGYHIDMLVEEAIVVEIKCVAKLLPIHQRSSCRISSSASTSSASSSTSMSCISAMG